MKWNRTSIPYEQGRGPGESWLWGTPRLVGNWLWINASPWRTQSAHASLEAQGSREGGGTWTSEYSQVLGLLPGISNLSSHVGFRYSLHRKGLSVCRWGLVHGLMLRSLLKSHLLPRPHRAAHSPLPCLVFSPWNWPLPNYCMYFTFLSYLLFLFFHFTFNLFLRIFWLCLVCKWQILETT